MLLNSLNNSPNYFRKIIAPSLLRTMTKNFFFTVEKYFRSMREKLRETIATPDTNDFVESFESIIAISCERRVKTGEKPREEEEKGEERGVVALARFET